MYDHVTVKTVYTHKPNYAAEQIDHAISLALLESKPVYIEVACNLALALVSSPTARKLKTKRISDPQALSAALDTVSEKLNNAIKPVFVAGSKLRARQAGFALESFAHKSSYALAAMPDAKGFVSEAHPDYIGIYWGRLVALAVVKLSSLQIVIYLLGLILATGPIVGVFSDIHTTCVGILVFIGGIHILAALTHQLLGRNHILKRMMPILGASIRLLKKMIYLIKKYDVS